jgi:GNAT superfamily N-acetyltransferase
MIQQVQSQDWQRLRDVRLRALAEDPGAFLATYDGESQFEEDEWRQRATPGAEQASFVVERDGRFDGLVSCFFGDDPKHVFLVAMWVEPALRGTGVARELVEHVVDWARAHDAERVLLSVEGPNVRAARLYERCGFVATTNPPPFPYSPHVGNRFFEFVL